MAGNSATITLLINADGTAAVEMMNQVFAMISSTNDKIGTSSGALVQRIKGQWASLSPYLGAAYKAALVAWDLGKEAAMYQQSYQAFESMMRAKGLSASREFSRIRQASAGLIDDKSLVESTNKALSLGLSIGQIEQLLPIARAKARDMGVTTEQAFDSIVAGIGKATGQLSTYEQKQALIKAALEQGKSVVEKYDLSQKTAAENMLEFEANLKDTANVIVTMLVPGFNQGAKALNEFLGGWLYLMSKQGQADATLGEQIERKQELEEGRRRALDELHTLEKHPFWGRFANASFDNAEQVRARLGRINQEIETTSRLIESMSRPTKEKGQKQGRPSDDGGAREVARTTLSAHVQSARGVATATEESYQRQTNAMQGFYDNKWAWDATDASLQEQRLQQQGELFYQSQEEEERALNERLQREGETYYAAKEQIAQAELERMSARKLTEEEEHQAKLERIRAEYDARIQYLTDATAIEEAEAAKRRAVNEEEAAYQDALNQRRVQQFGAMSQALLALGGKYAKIGHRMQQAMALRETYINTKAAAIAAYKAMVGIPYVGPVLAVAAAAAAVAFGMQQARAIMSDSGGAASAPSGGGGGGYTTPMGGPATPPEMEEAEKPAPSYVVNYHVYGNVFDLDETGRQLAPAIDRAKADGV